MDSNSCSRPYAQTSWRRSEATRRQPKSTAAYARSRSRSPNMTVAAVVHPARAPCPCSSYLKPVASVGGLGSLPDVRQFRLGGPRRQCRQSEHMVRPAHRCLGARCATVAYLAGRSTIAARPTVPLVRRSAAFGCRESRSIRPAPRRLRLGRPEQPCGRRRARTVAAVRVRREVRTGER